MVITKVARIPQIQLVAARRSLFRGSGWLVVGRGSGWLGVGMELIWVLKSSIWKGNVFNART